MGEVLEPEFAELFELVGFFELDGWFAELAPELLIGFFSSFAMAL